MVGGHLGAIQTRARPLTVETSRLGYRNEEVPFPSRKIGRGRSRFARQVQCHWSGCMEGRRRGAHHWPERVHIEFHAGNRARIHQGLSESDWQSVLHCGYVHQIAIGINSNSCSRDGGTVI